MSDLPLKDDKPYTLKLKIGNDSYEIDTKFLIHLRNDITEDKSSIELEKALEKISGYIHLISQAYRTASLKTKKYETKFESWYSDKYVEAEEKLTEEFREEYNQGSRSKTKIQPTQKQVKSRIISDNKEKWKEYKKKIEKSKVNEEFLYREFKMLKNRATHIQSLLSMRKEVIPTDNIK